MDFQKSVTTTMPYAESVAAVRTALGERGFGVITESDMRATLHTEIGVDIDPCVVAAEAGTRLDAVLATLTGR